MKGYNNFDYQKLVSFQKNITKDLGEQDVCELLRWVDARIFHNFVLENCLDAERPEVDYAIDVKGLEYSDLQGCLKKRVDFASKFRASHECVTAGEFATVICRRLGLDIKTFQTNPLHIWSIVNIGANEFTIDPTFGQFARGQCSDWIGVNTMPFQDLIRDGFVKLTQSNKKHYFQGSPCEMPSDPYVYNALTPAEILERR